MIEHSSGNDSDEIYKYLSNNSVIQCIANINACIYLAFFVYRFTYNVWSDDK